MKILIFSIVLLFGSNLFAASSAVCLNIFSMSSSFKHLKKKLNISDEEMVRIQSESIEYFTEHFRLPTVEVLAKNAKVSQEKIDGIYEHQTVFWQDVFMSYSGKIDDMREVLARSYYNFVKNFRSGGVTPRSVTVNELFEQLIKDNEVLEQDARKGKFELKHLQRLLGMRSRREGKAQYPILFSDIGSLRLAAKEKYPNAFKGFRDQNFGQKYNEDTLELLMSDKINGFLATSILGGIPWNKPMFTSLEKIAKEKKLLILIKEINGDTDAIPSVMLASPFVRIVTQTLDLGNHLRVWGDLVVLPTNKNSLAGLLERNMSRKRGQSQIVFAPQRTMLPVGTEKNHIVGPHQVWSTGSLNLPIYPYTNQRSSRVNKMAKERHFNSALIIEKSDRFSGPLEQGAPDRWHIRNVDFENEIQVSNKENYPEGMADNFLFYPADGTAPRPIPAVAVVPGDFHVGFQSEVILKSMFEQIFTASKNAGRAIKFIRLHDFLDFDTISPWDRAADRAKKFPIGKLDLRAEINKARSILNALLKLEPDLMIILNSMDNHNAWLQRQIDNPEALQDPVNGPLLMELRAIKDKGYDVFEYLFLHQKKFDESIPDGIVRDKILNQNVYVEKPTNILVLRKGQTYEVGPDGRPWLVSQHGDKIDRGRKAGASLEPHAKAADRVIVGHTHEAGIVGNAFNPGMVIRLRSQDYALNGYSTQQNAVVVIYENGAAQMMIFDPLIGRFYPDPKVGVLPADKFFKEKPFVVPDDNNLVDPGTKVINNYEQSPVR